MAVPSVLSTVPKSSPADTDLILVIHSYYVPVETVKIFNPHLSDLCRRPGVLLEGSAVRDIRRMAARTNV